MILNDKEFRDEAIKFAAYLMSISARTAPKSKGEDDIEIVFADGEDKDKIAEKMIELQKERKGFRRDGENIKLSSGVLLIGVNGGTTLGLNCGACGYDCNTFPEDRQQGKDFVGPNCIFKILDLGIALGSAVKLASLINVDNRIMYRVGTAAKMLGIINSDVVMGIPLSSTGKSPFFDRLETEKAKKKEKK